MPIKKRTSSEVSSDVSSVNSSEVSSVSSHNLDSASGVSSSGISSSSKSSSSHDNRKKSSSRRPNLNSKHSSTLPSISEVNSSELSTVSSDPTSATTGTTLSRSHEDLKLSGLHNQMQGSGYTSGNYSHAARSSALDSGPRGSGQVLLNSGNDNLSSGGVRSSNQFEPVNFEEEVEEEDPRNQVEGSEFVDHHGYTKAEWAAWEAEQAAKVKTSKIISYSHQEPGGAGSQYEPGPPEKSSQPRSGVGGDVGPSGAGGSEGAAGPGKLTGSVGSNNSTNLLKGKGRGRKTKKPRAGSGPSGSPAEHEGGSSLSEEEGDSSGGPMGAAAIGGIVCIICLCLCCFCFVGIYFFKPDLLGLGKDQTKAKHGGGDKNKPNPTLSDQPAGTGAGGAGGSGPPPAGPPSDGHGGPGTGTGTLEKDKEEAGSEQTQEPGGGPHKEALADVKDDDILKDNESGEEKEEEDSEEKEEGVEKKTSPTSDPGGKDQEVPESQIQSGEKGPGPVHSGPSAGVGEGDSTVTAPDAGGPKFGDSGTTGTVDSGPGPEGYSKQAGDAENKFADADSGDGGADGAIDEADLKEKELDNLVIFQTLADEDNKKLPGKGSKEERAAAVREFYGDEEFGGQIMKLLSALFAAAGPTGNSESVPKSFLELYGSGAQNSANAVWYDYLHKVFKELTMEALSDPFTYAFHILDFDWKGKVSNVTANQIFETNAWTAALPADCPRYLLLDTDVENLFPKLREQIDGELRKKGAFADEDFEALGDDVEENDVEGGLKESFPIMICRRPDLPQKEDEFKNLGDIKEKADYFNRNGDCGNLRIWAQAVPKPGDGVEKGLITIEGDPIWQELEVTKRLLDLHGADHVYGDLVPGDGETRKLLKPRYRCGVSRKFDKDTGAPVLLPLARGDKYPRPETFKVVISKAALRLDTTEHYDDEKRHSITGLHYKPDELDKFLALKRGALPYPKGVIPMFSREKPEEFIPLRQIGHEFKPRLASDADFWKPKPTRNLIRLDPSSGRLGNFTEMCKDHEALKEQFPPGGLLAYVPSNEVKFKSGFQSDSFLDVSEYHSRRYSRGASHGSDNFVYLEVSRRVRGRPVPDPMVVPTGEDGWPVLENNGTPETAEAIANPGESDQPPDPPYDAGSPEHASPAGTNPTDDVEPIPPHHPAPEPSITNAAGTPPFTGDPPDDTQSVSTTQVPEPEPQGNDPLPSKAEDDTVPHTGNYYGFDAAPDDDPEPKSLPGGDEPEPQGLDDAGGNGGDGGEVPLHQAEKEPSIHPENGEGLLPDGGGGEAVEGGKPEPQEELTPLKNNKKEEESNKKLKPPITPPLTNEKGCLSTRGKFMGVAVFLSVVLLLAVWFPVFAIDPIEGFNASLDRNPWVIPLSLIILLFCLLFADIWGTMRDLGKYRRSKVTIANYCTGSCALLIILVGLAYLVYRSVTGEKDSIAGKDEEKFGVPLIVTVILLAAAFFFSLDETGKPRPINCFRASFDPEKVGKPGGGPAMVI